MKITCPHCQKNYNINDAKIPAGVKTAKCKACGRPVALKLEDATGSDLVHSLKKEASSAQGVSDKANAYPGKSAAIPNTTPKKSGTVCDGRRYPFAGSGRDLCRF